MSILSQGNPGNAVSVYKCASLAHRWNVNCGLVVAAVGYGDGAGASVPLPAPGRAPPTGGMNSGIYPVQSKLVSICQSLNGNMPRGDDERQERPLLRAFGLARNTASK